MQAAMAGLPVVLILLSLQPLHSQDKSFQLMEATINDVHSAYKSGTLTARQLVQLYRDRIEAYDKNGPAINSVININPKALEEAGRLDAAMRSGFVGPLHGIPVVLKDMIDVAGLPTTYGSSIMKNFVPGEPGDGAGSGPGSGHLHQVSGCERPERCAHRHSARAHGIFQ